MPTYEYKCTKCGQIFEAFQKMSDAPVKKCPKCDGPVEKMISGGAGLIFKGSGFYETDYKKKEAPKNDSKTSQPSSCHSDPSSCACAQTKKT